VPLVDIPAARVPPDAIVAEPTHIGPTHLVPTQIEADAAAIVGALGSGSTLLSETQQAILDFERRWWRQPGAKEQAIRDHFEMSPTRYYQTLSALLDLPQALSYDPALVHRLLRVRSSSTVRRGRLD
jgi:hypothetical protein